MVNQDPPLTIKRGQPVGPELVRQAAERLSASHQDPARDAIRKKWDILTGNVKPYAEKRLDEQYYSDVTRMGTRAQITRTMNPAADIVERVCQVYKHGVRRRIAGVSQKKNRALSQLYREAKANAKGQGWEHEAYFVGPDTVVPQVKSEEMRLTTVLAHKRVPILDEDDRLGKPLAIAYEVARGDFGCVVVVVDQHSTKTYAVAGGQVKVIGEVDPNSSLEQKAPPFAELRFDSPTDVQDYDSSWRHQRLADGSIDVVVTTAVMGHVRKTQNKQLLVLQGALDGLIKGQNLGDPDKPVMLPTPLGQENALALSSINFDQPVDNFLAQIRFWYAAMAESTGVPAMLATEGPIDLQFAYDGLNELREKLIPFVEDFERDLCCAMVMAARDGGHPVALELPTVDEVKKGFTLTFNKMSRHLADPLQEQMALDWEIRHGMISVIDLLGRKYPDMDDEALLEKLQETLETNTQYWDFMARTNMAGEDQGGGASVDASGKAVNAAQANGAKGGRPSGTKKPQEGAPASAGRSSGRQGKSRAPGGKGRGRGAAQGPGGGAEEAEGARRGGQGGRAGEAVRGGARRGANQGAGRGQRAAFRRAWLAA